MAVETHTGTRQPVEVRARIASVAIAAEAVRPEGVDENEEHVDVVALAQPGDVVDCAQRPWIDLRTAAFELLDGCQ